jgi:hypothetical protein
VKSLHADVVTIVKDHRGSVDPKLVAMGSSKSIEVFSFTIKKGTVVETCQKHQFVTVLVFGKVGKTVFALSQPFVVSTICEALATWSDNLTHP